MNFLWFSVTLSMVSTLAAKSITAFHAAILHSNNRSSGALISDQHILTTAKAVQGLEQGVVILGASVLTQEHGRQEFEVSKANVIVHEKSDGSSHRYNIALIKLPHAATQTGTVKPITLPDQTDHENSFEEDTVYISQYKSYRKFVALDVLETRAVNPYECDSYFKTPENNTLCMDSDSVCAEEEGGPMVIRRSNTEKLIGLVTLTDDCEVNRMFKWNMATRVSSFSDWINEKLHLRR